MAVCFVVPKATRFASPREELHSVWRRVAYVFKSGVSPHNNIISSSTSKSCVSSVEQVVLLFSGCCASIVLISAEGLSGF